MSARDKRLRELYALIHELVQKAAKEQPESAAAVARDAELFDAALAECDRIESGGLLGSC